MEFEGKIAIVTGATGGIGQQLVRQLVDEGATVMITGRSEAACEDLAAQFSDGRVAAMAGDVTDGDFAQRLVDETVARFTRVDLLFNNAGSIPRGTASETTDEMWDNAISVNLTSVFKLSRAAIMHMERTGGGAIVNTASAWGLYPGPAHMAYCTAKGALIAMTRCMGRDHASAGIRVNAVCPNEVDTPMLRTGFEHRGIDPTSAIKDLGDTVPLGHVATPDEIVDALLFLASERSRYVTGTILEVTGAKPVY